MAGYVFRGTRYEWPRWSAAPGSLRSEWCLRAFRGGCDYGGSGQVLRAAFWYHSVRLRCRHALVARRLLRLQFCVWVSAAVTRPGIPVPGLSVCALPSSFHPSPTPPRPPFQGVAGGGELGGGDSSGIGVTVRREGLRSTYVAAIRVNHIVTSK